MTNIKLKISRQNFSNYKTSDISIKVYREYNGKIFDETIDFYAKINKYSECSENILT